MKKKMWKTLLPLITLGGVISIAVPTMLTSCQKIPIPKPDDTRTDISTIDWQYDLGGDSVYATPENYQDDAFEQGFKEKNKDKVNNDWTELDVSVVNAQITIKAKDNSSKYRGEVKGNSLTSTPVKANMDGTNWIGLSSGKIITDPSIGLIIGYETDDEGYSLSGVLNIPSYVWIDKKAYKIISIASDAFGWCLEITSLTLPSSLTSIGDYAFYRCSGITGSLILPNTLTSIGDGAFADCLGITGSLTLPSTLTSIGDGAFYACSGISKLTNPTGNLGNYYSIIEYGDVKMVLNGKGRLTYDGSQVVGCVAFGDNLDLSSIRITSINNDAFYGCSGITGPLTLPDSLTSIGDSAFGGCIGITGSLIMPNALTLIGNNAFMGCSEITSLVLSSNLASIGELAFYGCLACTTVTFMGTNNPELDGLPNSGYNNGGLQQVREYDNSPANATYIFNEGLWTKQ